MNATCCAMLAFTASAATDLPGSLPTLTSPADTSGARIAFSELVHDFGELRPGQSANHSFIFTNTGSETLVITEVRPGCGCTTAGVWDKEVAPGGTGKIPLQFNSTGFSGPVTKSATVTCNDPTQTSLYLQLKGRVWTPLEYSPSMISFQYDPESPLVQTQVVRVVNHTTTPLTIEEPQMTNLMFKVRLSTLTPGKDFQVQVTTVPPIGPGMVSTYLALKTSSAEAPIINVPIYAFERQQVIVSPSQIILPGTPLATPLQQQVTIQNFSTNVLALSDAKVNIAGAVVKVVEVQSGKVYSLNVTFPADLTTSPAQNPVVTVKTSHPRYPLLQVPVFQPQPVRPPVAPVNTPALTTNLPANMRFVPAGN